MGTRSLSTLGEKVEAEQDKSSNSYFIPGKRGFSPQFPPPKNWNPVPKEKKPLKKPEEIPEPSKLQSITLDPKKADPKLLFKQSMKKMRYQYYKEHLGKQLKREQDIKNKLQDIEKRRQRSIQSHMQKSKEYIEKTLLDPFSAYNVLNPEGKTVLSHANINPIKQTIPSEFGATANGNGTITKAETEERIKTENKAVEDSINSMIENKSISKKEKQFLEPITRLKPPRITIEYPEEENKHVKEVRRSRRLELEEMKKQKRLESLVNLYHSTSSFVTYENMDDKVAEFFSSAKVSLYYGIGELLDEKKKNGGLLTDLELKDRAKELLNTLSGTSGDDSQIGIDGIIEYSQRNKV
ncbi:hypothetical protein BB558_001387 [Smittium angustum]|nr:hypothetical protein BB558_001387 [Smittium angustum]